MTLVFKMRDSVPSASYSSVCNVLRQWSISLIPLIESTDSMIFLNRELKTEIDKMHHVEDAVSISRKKLEF